MPMSGISASRTFNFRDLINSPAPHAPTADPFTRTKRSATPEITTDEKSPRWTFPPPSARTNRLAPLGDRQLQTAVSGPSLGGVADKRVHIPTSSTLFPAFDAYRNAINSPDTMAWFMKQGIALSTLVVTADSVCGAVTREGVTRIETFTPRDASGWWRHSPRVSAAAAALDVAGKGLPFISDDSDVVSRNTVLLWYGIKPPAHEGDLGRVRNELAASDWFALPAATSAQFAQRLLAARTVVDKLDERKRLAAQLNVLLAAKPDDEAINLAGVLAQISSTSPLAKPGSTTAPISDVLHALELPLPKTAGELRNVLRWLNVSLPPAPALGNYAQLISNPWVPGTLSGADKRYLAGLGEGDSAQRKPSRLLLCGGIIDKVEAHTLRAKADVFLDKILTRRAPQLAGAGLATTRQFRDPSATLAATQWVLAAIMLQIDPEAPGRPGVIAGYDIYQPANNGRSFASVREDIEAHLKQKLGPDAHAAPLVAHLFLASAAPEFLIPDIPSTLHIGSNEWADLRLGVAFAERQSGPGASRALPYTDVMALTRLDPRNAEEAAVLDNYGVAPLLDWGLMQGLYSKPADGLYTPQHYQHASEAFGAQREDLLQALKAFKVPLPTRRDLAIAHLQKVFPDLGVQRLQAMRVHIADPNERRNMKLSEPRTRSLIETYMTGDLTAGRWMLMAPGEQAPERPTPKTPYLPAKGLSRAQQAVVDKNVQALDARIARLPDVQGLVAGAVDTYLHTLKQGLGSVTRRMIANLPLADRQALELGNVELFALREQTDSVPTVEQTPGQVEERRGRKGTLVRSEYNGVIRYFEVFPDKTLIVKRDDLPNTLTLGGTSQDQPKVYGPWAPSITQLQNGAVEPFDFSAYSSDAVPRPGTTSPGIIIDKLGDTLAAAPTPVQGDTATLVPNSFSSARTEAIVERIMQGNFIHHRDTVLRAARGELPLEQNREVLRRNDAILLGMIPFVGAIMDMAKGNWVEGSRALLIDTVGALVGGAGATFGPLVKSTKAIVPFGSKVFRVLEHGVTVISGFLNPLDGSADLLAAGAKGVFAVPKLLSKAPRPAMLARLGAVEEKLRTYLVVNSGLEQLATDQNKVQPGATSTGHYHGVSINAMQIDGLWYATDPETGLAVGTPLDGFFSA